MYCGHRAPGAPAASTDTHSHVLSVGRHPDHTEAKCVLGRRGVRGVQCKRSSCQRVAKALALVLVVLPWFLGSLECCLLGCLLSCLLFDSLWGKLHFYIPLLSTPSYNSLDTVPCLLSKTICDFYIQKVSWMRKGKNWPWVCRKQWLSLLYSCVGMDAKQAEVVFHCRWGRKYDPWHCLQKYKQITAMPLNVI